MGRRKLPRPGSWLVSLHRSGRGGKQPSGAPRAIPAELRPEQARPAPACLRYGQVASESRVAHRYGENGVRGALHDAGRLAVPPGTGGLRQSRNRTVLDVSRWVGPWTLLVLLPLVAPARCTSAI